MNGNLVPSTQGRTILFRALLLSVLGAVACSQPEPPEPALFPNPLRFEEKMASFASADSLAPPPADPILFVGSSSIRLWPTDSLFAGLPVINRGFGGSHITDVNYYLDTVVLPYRPRAIVFYAGDNDVNSGDSPQEVLRDYKEFVTRVRQAGQNPRILFLSIKPSPSRWTAWPRMKEANDLIRDYSEADSSLEYVDLATLILESDGRPKGNVFISDSLHLNDEGYRIWTAELRPLLEAMPNR